MPRQTIRIVETPGPAGGTVFQSGTKGFGKVGTPKGSPSGGYRMANGPKGTFHNSYSATPKGNPFIEAQPVLPPMTLPEPTAFGYPVAPILSLDRKQPNFVIQSNPQH